MPATAVKHAKCIFRFGHVTEWREEQHKSWVEGGRSMMAGEIETGKAGIWLVAACDA